MTENKIEKLTDEEGLMGLNRALREMQAHGYTESYTGPDGKVMWRLTEKGQLASDEQLESLGDLYPRHQ
jgi:DNA-binding PadR family transcriptional regulator